MYKGHSTRASKTDGKGKLSRHNKSKKLLNSAAFEVLEHRTLMSNSVSLSNGILYIEGDPKAGSSLVAALSSNGKQIGASAGQGHDLTVALSSVKEIQVIGGAGNDYIYIDQKIMLPVTISSGDGNDAIRGGGGKNTIYAGNGNNWISGRGSADYIQVGNGNDTILGGGGNDTIVAGNGNDAIDGSGGNDSITAGNGKDSLSGSSGDDTIVAGNGKDIVNGGLGNDKLIVGTGTSTIIPGSGVNSVLVNSKLSTVVRSAGATTVTIGKPATSSTVTAPVTPVVPVTPVTPVSPVTPVTPVTTTSPVKPVNPITPVAPTNSTEPSTPIKPTAPVTPVTPVGPTSPISPSSPSTPASPPITVNTGTVSSPGGSTNWETYSASHGSGTAPTAVLQVLAPAATVGIGVVVRALESSLGTGSPINANYQWNFGDSSGEYNTLTGFNASHIYTSAGTYNISLTVTNDAHQVSTVTASIAISPDSRRAIYVNAATGNDNNSGTSPSSPVQSANRASQLVADNTEIFFARGQTFNLDHAFLLDNRNVLVGAYGTGAQPVINYTAPTTGAVIFTTNSKVATGVTIQDLTMTTLNGSQPGLTDMPMAVMAGGWDTSVLRCTFLYVEYDINSSPAPVGLTAFDNSSPLSNGLHGYFLWDAADDSCVDGNYVNGSVLEHIIRSSGANEILITNNNFTNRDGKGCIEIHEGSYAWVDGNTVTGGDIRVGPLGLWGESTSLITNEAVIQNNSVNNTCIAVYPGAENISIRSNIITKDGGQLIDVLGQDGLGRQSANIFILDNTGIDTLATGQFLNVENHTVDITLENNLFIDPLMITGGYGAAPVSIAEGNMSSFSYISGNVWQEPSTFYYPARDGGINLLGGANLTPDAWNSLSVVGTDFFSATALTSNDAPASGTLASVADAPVEGVFTNFYGQTRSQNAPWAAGAV